MIGRAKEVAVTILGHPARTGEMRLVDVQGTVGLFVGIETEDDSDHFSPMRGVRFGIEQAQIGCKMGAIIIGQMFAMRRFVQKVSLSHISPSSAVRRRDAYG